MNFNSVTHPCVGIDVLTDVWVDVKIVVTSNIGVEVLTDAKTGVLIMTTVL